MEHQWVEAGALAVVESSPTRGALAFEQVQESIRALAPATQPQRIVQTRALQLAEDLAQTRWLLVEQVGGSIPMPFLVLLILWVALIFASLSLFAPSN